MSISYKNRLEADAAFQSLYQECSETCLWFLHHLSPPISAADRLAVLRQIELHGSLSQFQQAKELRKWL